MVVEGEKAAAVAMLAALATGCATTFTRVHERTQIVALVQQNQFQEARELVVKACPEETQGQIAPLVMNNRYREARELLQKSSSSDATSISTKVSPLVAGQMVEKMMSKALQLLDLAEKLIISAEAKYTAERIRALEAQVQTALDDSDDDAARQVIYNFGITRQRTVDSVTFLAKCAYLNSRVNPATTRQVEAFREEKRGGGHQGGRGRESPGSGESDSHGGGISRED